MMKIIICSNIFRLTLVSASVLLISCAGQSIYLAPGETTQINANFTDTDNRMMAQSMYNSLQNRLQMIKDPSAPTPIVALLKIDNKTSEHIDTEVISDKLQIEMLRAGTLRFVDRTAIKDAAREWDLGGSGMMNPEMVKAAGQVLGADFLLTGVMTSIKQSEGRTQINFYRLSMRLLDSETTEVVWADEYEIKKMSRRGLIVW